MVRFKVIRGSHLLLALSALVLAAVLIFILLQANDGDVTNDAGGAAPVTSQVSSVDEAKVLSAFASASSISVPLQIEVVADEQDLPPLSGAPSILIYHTHTHEAYEQVSHDLYEAVETWRTEDANHSVVRVGAALADELTKLGCFVVHDTTDHEQNDISNAYIHSLETLESYSVPFDLCIDLHRDAYVEGLPLRFEDDEGSYAQIMLLVGDGGEYTGEEAPDYAKNLIYAQALTNSLNTDKPGIARNVTVKKGRYNQHIGEAAALIEVGHNKNTLEEALSSVPFLAKAIANTLNL